MIIETGNNIMKHTNLLPDLKPKQYIESSQIVKVNTNINDIPKFKPVM